MKRIEKKVRDEISRIIINHHLKTGKKGHIGKVFIEAYKYEDELWIDCVYNAIFVRLIIDSEDVIRKVIVGKKGLTQLRQLLEKLKR